MAFTVGASRASPMRRARATLVLTAADTGTRSLKRIWYRPT